MFCLLTENTNACDADVKGMGIGGEGEDQATSVYPPAIYCPDFIITKVFVFPSHASWNSFATFVLVGWSLVLKSLVAFVNCDSRDERKLNGELFLVWVMYSSKISASTCSYTGSVCKSGEGTLEEDWALGQARKVDVPAGQRSRFTLSIKFRRILKLGTLTAQKPTQTGVWGLGFGVWGLGFG